MKSIDDPLVRQVADQLSTLVNTKREFVDVTLEEGTLRVHAKVFRVEQPERMIAIDYRAKMPSPLSSELTDVLQRVSTLAKTLREVSGNGAKAALERYGELHLTVTGERSNGPRTSVTDTINDGLLRDMQ